MPTAHPRPLTALLCALLLALQLGCGAKDEARTPEVLTEPTLVALTPSEFNNTVRDLLGMPADADDWPAAPDLGVAPPLSAGEGIFGVKAAAPPVWPYAFPPEAGVDGFEGMAGGQAPSTYQIEQLQKAARHFGAFALVSPVFFTCDKAAFATLPEAERDACAEQSLLRFAQRAWRRPLSAEESARLTALWQAMKLLGTPQQAIALAVSGVLQAPSFLFRIERGDPNRAVGGAVPLSDWELASRLSYALWDSMPDPALFAAAAKGQLRTAAQVEAQARRMLADPKALAAIVRFHHQWLGTDQLHRVSPARRVYGPLFGIEPVPPLDTTGDATWPSLMNPLRRSFEVETELFVRDALFGRPGRDTNGLSDSVPGGAKVGSLSALLTMEQGYVSQQSAVVYGVTDKDIDQAPDKAVKASGAGVAAVSGGFNVTLRPAVFPAGQRAGVLTLPGVLALRAHAVHPSPILRGVFLLSRVACVEFGAPPATAEAAAPADAPGQSSTNRERTVASTKALECTGCHDTLGINMAGFAFEHYDSFGHWRATDAGKPVDASGTLPMPGQPDIAFTDGVDLSRKLAKSGRVRDCYARHWTRYLTGAVVPDAHPALARLQERFRADDDVIALLVAIVTSDLFRYRAAPSATGVK